MLGIELGTTGSGSENVYYCAMPPPYKYTLTEISRVKIFGLPSLLSLLQDVFVTSTRGSLGSSYPYIYYFRKTYLSGGVKDEPFKT